MEQQPNMSLKKFQGSTGNVIDYFQGTKKQQEEGFWEILFQGSMQEILEFISLLLNNI